MYEMENEIPFTRTGSDGKLKLHEAAAMMMDCCQFQEYQEQEFCRFLRTNQIAVFLFSIQIDILRMPAFRERVRTAVRIYGCKSIYGLRRITMRDESNRICLISNATGAFFDLRAGKAIKLEPEDLCVRFDEPEPMECLPRKIPVPASGGAERPGFAVTPSFLDPNGHFTTPAYFSVAGDALPEGFRFNRVRMEFKKQARPGEIIRPVLYECPDERRTVVDLRGEGELSCAVAEFTTARLPEYD